MKVNFVLLFVLLFFFAGCDSPIEVDYTVTRERPMRWNFTIASEGPALIYIRKEILPIIIKVFKAENMSAGSYEIEWNFTDDRGKYVLEGYYRIVLQTASLELHKTFYLSK